MSESAISGRTASPSDPEETDKRRLFGDGALSSKSLSPSDDPWLVTAINDDGGIDSASIESLKSFEGGKSGGELSTMSLMLSSSLCLETVATRAGVDEDKFAVDSCGVE